MNTKFKKLLSNKITPCRDLNWSLHFFVKYGICTLLIGIGHPCLLLSQNLINNPDFEEYIKCRESDQIGGYFNDYVTNWNSYPDSETLEVGAQYHQDCFQGDDYWWNLGIDSMNYLTGFSILNLPWSKRSPQNKKRRYFFSRLKKSMIKDSTYYVSYHIHYNRHYPISDHVGLTFISDTSQIYVGGVSYLTEDYIGFKNEFKGPDKLWHKISGCYIAKGDEQWVLIGTFIPDEDIHFHSHVGFFANSAATILLDDVSVTLTTKVKEQDHDLEVCDYEIVELPQPSQPNVKIINSQELSVTHTTVDWPDIDTFFYMDDCFGRLGSIIVKPIICIDSIEEAITICPEQSYDLRPLLCSECVVLDNNNEEIESIDYDTPGTRILLVYHPRYGYFGTITVNVIACDDCKLYTPNIISPKSLSNNYWRIFTLCGFEQFEVLVYDRWGNNVYQSIDSTFEWDGTYSGKQISSGVYTYMIRYKFLHPTIPQKTEYRYGDLTILN